MPRPAVGLTLVKGLSVGHSVAPGGRTGVTVVRFDHAVPCVVEVGGGASATYDTASLALDATYGRRWAIFFAGGSLFGLDAARGVRTAILLSGGGHRVFGHPRKIAPVSGAALFDLPRGKGGLPDYATLGRDAASVASRAPAPNGAVGAGAGATVGKYAGRGRAMRGGLGTAALRWGPGAVGALVVVNAVGAVRDPSDGSWAAGARGPGSRVVPPAGVDGSARSAAGTTLAVVVTDFELTRPTLARIASIASAGLGRAIVPYRTSTDGDVVFAVATGVVGRPRAETWPGALGDRIGSAAAECAVQAALRAVRASNPHSPRTPARRPRRGAKAKMLQRPRGRTRSLGRTSRRN